jgi:hypothetical protein
MRNALIYGLLAWVVLFGALLAFTKLYTTVVLVYNTASHSR